MDYNKISAIATSFLAFSSFLGVLIALVYYSFQIKKLNVFQVLIGAIIYIDVNLLFLYTLKKNILYD
jgi:lipid-A-disaccharide synthase-like uncharacterized protein